MRIAGAYPLTKPQSALGEDFDLHSLCVAIQTGCKASEENLCNILSPGLKLYLKRRTRNDYRDALNETLLRMLEAIRSGTLRTPKALPAYVRTVAHNYLTKHVYASRTVSLNSEIEHPVGETDSVQDGEKLRALENALGELESIDREIIIRFYRLEEPMLKIANDLGIGLKSAILRKSRALAKLREKVSRNRKREELRKLAKSIGSENLGSSLKNLHRLAGAA